MNNNIGYSNMSSLEYICTCFSIAGLFWLLTCYEPTHYDISQPIIMDCPSLVIRHSVESNLKTSIQAVDSCSEHLNVIK